MSRLQRAPAGDRATMALSTRLLRTRPARAAEARAAGIAGPALSILIKTCGGTLMTVVAAREVTAEFSLIGNALALRWNRPRAEVHEAITAALVADEGALSDLSTALIAARTTCSKATCVCGASYAPLLAAMVPDDAQAGAAFEDYKAVHGGPTAAHVQSERVKQEVATTKILQGMRAKMMEGAR